MGESSLSTKLARYFLENYEVTNTQRGNSKIEEFNISGNGLAKRFAHRFILPNRDKFIEIDKTFALLPEKELIEELNNIMPTIREGINNHLQNLQIQETSSNLQTPLYKEDYINAIPIIDMEDPRGRAVMIDKTTHRPSLVEEKSWERVVGQKHVQTVAQIGYCGRFEYNPYSYEPYREMETEIGKEVMYNKYIPPNHLLEPEQGHILDKRFEEFFTGLFTNDKCRQYAINWTYYSMFKRQPVYMVMVGAGGIGKNLFAETLKYMHGVTNFRKAPPSALDTKFNGHLPDCTALYYDECKFSAGREGSTTRKNKLKEWANPYVPIEIKGVDSTNKDIFCSALIATNHDSDVHLEQLDRKFSVMELTELRLEKRMGVEVVQWLWEYIKTEEFRHAFLAWLKERADKDYNEHIEYKGERFKELVLSSLYVWQQELLFNHILEASQDTLSIKTLKEEITNFPRQSSKVNDFLVNFRWEGHSLGKIVTLDGQQCIKIDDYFTPPELKDTALERELN